MDTGLRSIEPTIGITSDGTVFIGPGVPPSTGGPQLTPQGFGAIRSRDGGATWDLAIPSLAGVPAQNLNDDPFLYVDAATSRAWLETLEVVGADHCNVLSWSDDDGASWETSVAGCTQADHTSLFAGPAVRTPTLGYPNLLYACAYNTVGADRGGFSQTCEKSPDGGRTWLPAGSPAYGPGTSGGALAEGVGPCIGGAGHGIADRQGTIYLPRGHCREPDLAISDDEGLTWRVVQVSDLGMGMDGNPERLCYPIEPACIDVPPFSLHDAAVGIEPDGAIDYAWVAADHLAHLVRSVDHGATWSAALNVTPPGVDEVRFVELAAGASGHVALAMVASTSSPGAPFTYEPDVYANTTWNGYLVASLDVDTARPTFVAATVNDPGDPLVRGLCCGAIYDFIDVKIAPDGTPWASFVDGCTDACATDGTTPPGRNAYGGPAVAGRLWGVDLWDAADPNGPYPG